MTETKYLTFPEIPFGTYYYHKDFPTEIRQKIDNCYSLITQSRISDRPIGYKIAYPTGHTTASEYVIYNKQDVPHIYRDPDATIFVLAYIPSEGRWIDIANCKDGEMDKIKEHVEEYKRAYPNTKLVITHITHTIDMQVNFNPVVSSDVLRID